MIRIEINTIGGRGTNPKIAPRGRYGSAIFLNGA
jgi:hypothetical protein